MATPDRGLRDKALNIINNVGQYGPLDATIDSYKQAADYADDARLYAEQALSGVTDLNTQIERVTALANEVETLTTEVNEAYTQVTTLDVDAVDGEAAAVVYNKEENKIHFTLPKGKDGVDGDDGKSAYQSYLDTTTDNPKLSEADWILSLKGKDGKDGTNGKDGVNGANGTNGTNGTNGYSAYELAVIAGYTGTLEDFNEMNTKSLDRNQNLSELTNVPAARTNLDVNSKSEVTSAITAASTGLQTNIDAKANKGANSDITALSGLTVALSIAQGGTGSKTAVDAKNNLGIRLFDAKDYGAVGNGTTLDTTSINNAVSARNTGSVLLPNSSTPEAAKYLVGTINNKFGVRFAGGGALVQTDPAGGVKQINFAQDTYYPSIGFEYLYAAYQKLAGGQTASSSTLNIFVYGDSTVSGGNGEDSAYKVEQFLPSVMGKKGLPNIIVTNRGVGGTSVSDLNALPDVSATTKLFIIKYGINDGGNGRADRLDYFATNLRSKLSAIRAATNGDLKNLSIILVGPNSTNDSRNNRNAYWYEQIRGVYLQAARDYQCAYFDTYSLMPDSYGLAGSVLDAPFSDATGIGIHPMNTGQAWIWGKLADTFFNSSSVSMYKTNHFVSYGSVNGRPLSTTLATSFQYGINLYRGTTSDGYPVDGTVETIRSVDAPTIQRNFGYSSSSVSKCLTRTYNVSGNTWNTWTGTAISLTASGGWTAVRAEYRVSVDGLITISAYLTGGTTATGTTILTGLPAEARPAAEKRFAQSNDDGTHTCIGISASGNIFLVGSATNSAGVHVNLSYYV